MSVNPVAPGLSPESAPRTMVYTVDLGNGQVADVEGPEGATPEQLQAALARSNEVAPDIQGGFAGEQGPQVQNTLAPDDEAALQNLYRTGSVADIQQFLQSRGRTSDAQQLATYVANRDKGAPTSTGVTYDFPQVADDGALAAGGRGALDTLTMGTLPKAGALIAGAEAALQGDSFGDAYGRTLDSNNATVGSDEQNHPWARLTGQLAGGAVLPLGLESVAARAEASAIAAGRSVEEAHAIGQAALRQRLVTSGAGYGAVHGAGSADTLGDAAAGAVTEGTAGAVLGAALPYAGRVASGIGARLPGRGPTQQAQDTAAAASRLGIDVLPADVGGPTIRRLTSAAAQAPLSASPVISAAQRSVEQAQGARDRIASDIGQVLRPEAAGDTIRQGAQAYIKDSGSRIGRIYDAAEKAAGDTRVAPTQALANLDQHIADLSETPGGASGLDVLQSLRDSLAQGDVSVVGMRQMRTQLRDKFAQEGLRGSDLERRVGQVVDAAQQDVANRLSAAGKSNAAALYRQADTQWRERVQTIDKVLEPIIGKEGGKSGEAIVKSLTADLQANNARAVKLLATLPDEAQKTTRASIIGAMGRQANGAQNAESDGFSLAKFLTHWNDIGETAKRAYFGNEARAALNDLAKVAQGTKEAAAYANRSNTGGAVGGLLTGATGLLGIATLGKTLAVQYGAGKLLASPRFARWLARAPRTAIAPHAYVERLSRIARAEPAIANEVLSLQQRLTSAFNDNQPIRAAAQEPSNETAVGNRQ